MPRNKLPLRQEQDRESSIHRLLKTLCTIPVRVLVAKQASTRVNSQRQSTDWHMKKYRFQAESYGTLCIFSTHCTHCMKLLNQCTSTALSFTALAAHSLHTYCTHESGFPPPVPLLHFHSQHTHCTLIAHSLHFHSAHSLHPPVRVPAPRALTALSLTAYSLHFHSLHTHCKVIQTLHSLHPPARVPASRAAAVNVKPVGKACAGL